jgi:hypothetical protein
LLVWRAAIELLPCLAFLERIQAPFAAALQQLR